MRTLPIVAIALSLIIGPSSLRFDEDAGESVVMVGPGKAATAPLPITKPNDALGSVEEQPT